MYFNMLLFSRTLDNKHDTDFRFTYQVSEETVKSSDSKEYFHVVCSFNEGEE